MNPCCRWHITCKIAESNGHIFVTCTAGSCDIDSALSGHNSCTLSNLVKGRNVEANRDVRVSQLCTRLPHSTLCIKTNSRKAAAQIIASIWRKWDIVNARPLPEGVERVWSEEIVNDSPLPGGVERVWIEHGDNSEVVWKKTGSPYYTSTSNSSA